MSQSPASTRTFAGWFSELPSGMSYRLWEQGGAEQREGEVALYTDDRPLLEGEWMEKAERLMPTPTVVAYLNKVPDADFPSIDRYPVSTGTPGWSSEPLVKLSEAWTPPTIEAMRAEFSKWAKRNGYPLSFVDGGVCPADGGPVYADLRTHAAWWAYRWGCKPRVAPVFAASIRPQRNDAEDAARYRWLRKEHESPLPVAHVVWKAGMVRAASEWVNTSSASELDAAIDAARKAI